MKRYTLAIEGASIVGSSVARRSIPGNLPIGTPQGQVYLGRIVQAVRLAGAVLSTDDALIAAYYVAKFGYQWLHADDRLDSDVRQFLAWTQQMIGQPATGALTHLQLIEMTMLDRCPMHDPDERAARFEPANGQWGKQSLTYYILMRDGDPQREAWLTAIVCALNEWQSACQLSFEPANVDHEADIVVRINPTYADKPPGHSVRASMHPAELQPLHTGRVILDFLTEAQPEDPPGYENRWLVNRLHHWIGHALGLTHRCHPESVMNPFQSDVALSPSNTVDLYELKRRYHGEEPKEPADRHEPITLEEWKAQAAEEHEAIQKEVESNVATAKLLADAGIPIESVLGDPESTQPPKENGDGE